MAHQEMKTEGPKRFVIPTLVYLFFFPITGNFKIYSQSFVGWCGSVLAQVLAIAAPADSWKFSITAEFVCLLLNPATYIGIMIGTTSRSWKHLPESLVPAVALLGLSCALWAVPFGFFSAPIAHYVLLTAFPYTLIGAAIGWKMQRQLKKLENEKQGNA